MRKLFLCLVIGLTFITVCAYKVKHPKNGQFAQAPLQFSQNHQLDNMPLVQDDPYAQQAHRRPPQHEMQNSAQRWLSSGVRINVDGVAGSGTIVYYDSRSNWAYVQSCGHIWEEPRTRTLPVKITVWYHNGVRLPREEAYPAEVLYYSTTRGQDVSLMRFHPTWQPDYFPIAPENYSYAVNGRYNSVGCDHGKEVALYRVRFLGMRDVWAGWPDIVTTENSPRPGRSGGGLMSDDGYFVGICWGTSNFSGQGNGFFTPLRTVRRMNEKHGYGWLNEVGFSIARQIPIRDRNNPQRRYSPDYIPLPGR